MNDGQKKRYKQLMQSNKSIERNKIWSDNILLQECLAALGIQKDILSINEQEKIVCEVNQRFKETVKKKEGKKIETIEEIDSEWIGEKVFIIWDEASLPVIQTKINSVKEYIDDVTAVAFDTWIVSEDLNRVIEYNHNGKITAIEMRSQEVGATLSGDVFRPGDAKPSQL